MISNGLVLTTWRQHDNDLNNLAYKTRCDSTVADAALRVGVESRRSFARWMVFYAFDRFLFWAGWPRAAETAAARPIELCSR